MVQPDRRRGRTARRRARCRPRRHSRARPACPPAARSRAAAAAQSRASRSVPSTIGGSRRARLRQCRARRGSRGSYARVRKLPKVKLPSEGSVARIAGQLEIEPVLAVKRRRGTCETIPAAWRLHPGELGPCWQALRPVPVRSIVAPILRARRIFRRPVEPRANRATARPAPTGSPVVSISHVPSPCPVTAMAATRAAKIGHLVGEIRTVSPSCRSRCAPCPARRPPPRRLDRRWAARRCRAARRRA